MSKLSKYFLLTGVFFWIVFGSNRVFAQSIDKGYQLPMDNPKVLFTKINTSSQFKAGNQRFQQLEKSKKSKNVDIVRLPEKLYNLQNLSLFIDEKTERINFQNFGTKLIIERTSLEIISDEEVAWVGKAYNELTKTEVGDVTLILDKNSNVTGSIDLEGNFYEIRSLGQSGLHAMQTIDNSSLKENRRKNDVAITQRGDSKNSTFQNQGPDWVAPSQSTPRCSPEYQRLLVVYTASAASGRNIDGIISLAIQEANESYSNSNVNTMRVALAHKQQINFNESNNIQDDLDELKLNSVVQNLRNQHQADAVLLITDGNYGGVIGLADAILATQNSAFGIVEADFSGGPDYTFAHELGHLQGAQHHPDDPVDPNGPFSYGFGHRFSYKASIFVPRRYRSTIMAYPCRPFSQDPFCDRVYSGRKHFSNPNVEYRGADTGIQGQRENWTVLKNTAATLADFRNPNEMKTIITTTSADPSTGNYTYSQVTCGGVTSVNYEWRVSLNDPFSYGSVVGTGATFNYTFPPGNHSVKLTVSSGSQFVTDYAVAYVSEEDCPPGQICGFQKLNPGNDKPLSVELNSAYPNPFNPNTTLSFTLQESGFVKLSVYNILGHEVASIVNERLDSGNHQYDFNANSLSSGAYIVRMQTEKNTLSQRITLIK